MRMALPQLVISWGGLRRLAYLAALRAAFLFLQHDAGGLQPKGADLA